MWLAVRNGAHLSDGWAQKLAHSSSNLDSFPISIMLRAQPAKEEQGAAIWGNFRDNCLCSVARRKPATSYDNFLRDIGARYVKGYTAPTFADLFENAPFTE
jgi:hypothetical protein